MRPNPLWQLTLTRLRIFFREPSAIFWTFGFPIALSIALGIAFRNRPPEPVRVGIWSVAAPERSRVEHALRSSADLRVSSFASEHDAREALRTSKIDLIVVPGHSVEYVFDPSRPESRLARALADASLRPAPAMRTIDRPVVEPGSRYIDFLIPGLIGMNIMSSGMWGIGYVVVDMRTRRLLKRLIATPMSRAQFLWSFVL
ncbi:MAG TPA: ABC transporter permease, partial [Myxococcales bacterium]|nr:ABC transporter permease [Myxococcales bacterium]